MFKAILVAVDGSDQASRAVQTGAELASMANAKLDLVYVVDTIHMEVPEDLRRMVEVEQLIDPMPRGLVSFSDAPLSLFRSINDSSADAQRALYELAEFIVQQAKTDAQKAGVKEVETMIEIGNPADRILACSKRCESDLIITGRRGLSQLKSLILGSTSQKVTQHAQCDCLTIC